MKIRNLRHLISDTTPIQLYLNDFIYTKSNILFQGYFSHIPSEYQDFNVCDDGIELEHGSDYISLYVTGNLPLRDKLLYLHNYVTNLGNEELRELVEDVYNDILNLC